MLRVLFFEPNYSFTQSKRLAQTEVEKEFKPKLHYSQKIELCFFFNK